VPEALGGRAGPALGCESGISKSEVSRICQGLDVQVQAFLIRPLEFSRYPYVYLDATCLHGRDPARKQAISIVLIVAVGNGFAEA
jgi:transposase-like protein